VGQEGSVEWGRVQSSEFRKAGGWTHSGDLPCWFSKAGDLRVEFRGVLSSGNESIAVYVGGGWIPTFPLR
jgi:hypothetical protein